MRIAQIAPLFECVPPRTYGGTERVVSWLTEELVRQGHEVTLFAAGESRTKAKLVKVCPKPLWQDPSSLESTPLHVLSMERAFSNACDFDVLHFHTDYIHFPLLRRTSVPALTTLHGALNATDHGPLFSEYDEVALVAISDAQRHSVDSGTFVRTVHHGMPIDLHRYNPNGGDYLVFLGRATPHKGLDRAIRIAIATQHPLKIAARIYGEERAYYNEVIVPLLREAGSLVEFIGEVGGEEKDRLLGSAKALLFPVDWPEPFGLAMIEALAAGTPVIGWRNGSVPEVIQHEKTGFVVDSLEQAIAAVKRVDHIERRVCREAFESRFSVARMACDYIEVYRSLCDRRSVPRLITAPRSARSA